MIFVLREDEELNILFWVAILKMVSDKLLDFPCMVFNNCDHDVTNSILLKVFYLVADKRFVDDGA